MCAQTLPSAARANAVAIDRDSRVLVSLADGGLCGYGGSAALEQYLASLIAQASSEAERRGAIERIMSALESVRDPAGREFLIATVQNAGIDLFAGAKQAGAVTTWRLLGPVPWDNDKNTLDKKFVKDPEVKLNRPCKIAGGNLTWDRYVTVDANGWLT